MTATQPDYDFGGKPKPDPVDSPPAVTPPAAARITPLDALRAEVARQIAGEPITLSVPQRPGWAVRYRADIESGQLAMWRKRSADKSMPDGLDEFKFCATVLANQCEAIVHEGAELEDENGELVTFASKSFLEMFGVGRSIDAVKSWYGLDGHILSAAQEVITASGYGEDAQEADPTQG